MKNKLLIFAFVALAVFASVFVCDAACAESYKPWNVVFNVSYQNVTYSYSLEKEIASLESEASARAFYAGAKSKKRLAEEILKTGVEPCAAYEYILPGFKKIVDKFSFAERARKDAEVTFGKNGFTYFEGEDGITIDVKKLFLKALQSEGARIGFVLPVTIDRAVTVADLKKNTVKKASFTTTFYSSGANRTYNIALAASKLDGITVSPNETFSFNGAVGDRTEANGFKTSKVISGGNYVDGVGGGVCQVSTTLYNALLLSEFIPKAGQHSLVSSYVKAGFDAMVSYGSCDLTFTNDTDRNIYISAKVSGKSITFTVYGKPNVYRVERESEEIRDPYKTFEITDSEKYPELIYTDQIKVVTAGSDGVKTKSYLKYYSGDKLVEKRLIRQNSYKKVDKVIARGTQERPVEESGSAAEIY